MSPEEGTEFVLWHMMEKELSLNRPYQVVRPDILRKMMECGMRVSGGSIFVDNVVIADHALARALNIDRRVVKWTIEQVEKSKFLSSILSKTRPLGTSLADIAPQLGYIALVVEITGAPIPITDVIDILVRNGMEIKQILADSADITPHPKITAVAAGQLTDRTFGEIISLKQVKGIRIRE